MADIERKKHTLNGEDGRVNGRKERSKSGGCGRRGGVRNQSGMADGNGLDFAVLTADFELFSVELEVESAGVSGLDEDAPVGVKGALAASSQELRTDRLAVDRDGDPAFLAGVNEDEELAGGRSGA